MDIIEKMVEFYEKTVLENYYNFEGRTSLPEYWLFMAANAVVSLLFHIFDSFLDVTFFSVIYALAIVSPTVGAAARRMHDTGKSAYLLLWALVPIAGLIYVLYLLAQKGDAQNNEFGGPAR